MRQWVFSPAVSKTVKSQPHLNSTNITHHGWLVYTGKNKVPTSAHGLLAITTTINGYRSTSEGQ